MLQGFKMRRGRRPEIFCNSSADIGNPVAIPAQRPSNAIANLLPRFAERNARLKPHRNAIEMHHFYLQILVPQLEKPREIRGFSHFRRLKYGRSVIKLGSS